jgi:NCAIR mutase (PurE)-related protein
MAQEIGGQKKLEAAFAEGKKLADKEAEKCAKIEEEEGSEKNAIGRIQPLRAKERRKGFPEVIWGQGKTSGQILSIMKQLKKKGQNILITRLEEKKARAVQKVFLKTKYYPKSKVLTYLTHPVKSVGKGMILVITAGTTDIPVAEEAAITALENAQNIADDHDLPIHIDSGSNTIYRND